MKHFLHEGNMVKKIRIVIGLVILFSLMIWFFFYIDEKTSLEHAHVKADVESVERAVDQSNTLTLEEDEEYELFDDEDTE